MSCNILSFLQGIFLDFPVWLISDEIELKETPSLPLLSVHWHWQVHACSLCECARRGLIKSMCFQDLCSCVCAFLHVQLWFSQRVITVCDASLFAKCVDICNLCLSWLPLYTVSADALWEQVVACPHAPPSCCACVSWRVCSEVRFVNVWRVFRCFYWTDKEKRYCHLGLLFSLLPASNNLFAPEPLSCWPWSQCAVCNVCVLAQ